MNDRTDEILSTREPTLREDQIEVLGRYGQTRKMEAGQVLYRAGDPSNDFFVIPQGTSLRPPRSGGRTRGPRRVGLRGV